MILNRGKADANQVLKPETVELMTRNNTGDSQLPLKTAAPPLPTMRSSSAACLRRGA